MALPPQHGRDTNVLRKLRLVPLDRLSSVPRPTPAASVLPPLICVSHREPYAPVRAGAFQQLQRTTGGLVTALDAALRELGGRWIASGETAQTLEAPDDVKGRTYSIEQLALSERELDHYYSGFSNRVLWPLCHYFTGTVRFKPEEWHEYVKVNRRFADAVVHQLNRASGSPPVAWLHDYHLMLAPRMVRDRVPSATIGFFLHIPFPAFEVFRILPTRREILEGVLGADLIGFHSASYQEAFLESARRLLGARVERGSFVEHKGHRTRTMVAPIGIDVQHQMQLGADPRVISRAQKLRRMIGSDTMILGVDRLDYSKGILERLIGFERFLERHAEHRGHTTFVQVAVPSRTRVEEYKQLKKATDEMVGRINGRYGDAVWTPVRYMTRSLQAPELAAYYRAADVALVTPLRDGLNLVAKEYVATRVDHGGALILSEFTGAAEELPQAYIVNPFGPDNVADALQSALTDDRVERERRMAALHARVRVNDVHVWARSFVEHLVRVTH
jgi:trehalose 6-phosphate synthase